MNIKTFSLQTWSIFQTTNFCFSTVPKVTSPQAVDNSSFCTFRAIFYSVIRPLPLTWDSPWKGCRRLLSGSCAEVKEAAVLCAALGISFPGGPSIWYRPRSEPAGPPTPPGRLISVWIKELPSFYNKPLQNDHHAAWDQQYADELEEVVIAKNGLINIRIGLASSQQNPCRKIQDSLNHSICRFKITQHRALLIGGTRDDFFENLKCYCFGTALLK